MLRLVSDQKYALAVCRWFALLFVLNIAVAVVFDPFKVFGLTDFNQRNFEPNTRYMKIEYLKEHKFEGFVFGSSRANAYRTTTLEQLTGLKFYSLNVPSDTPHGMYMKLRWLLKRGKVKMVVIGLDFDAFDHPLNWDAHDLIHQEHPAVDGSFAPWFFWKFLWVTPRHHAINLYGNKIKAETWYTFDVSTGRYHFPLYRSQMIHSPKEFVSTRFTGPMSPTSYSPNPEQLRSLGLMIDAAKMNGAKVILIINPYHHIKWTRMVKSEFRAWRERMLSFNVEVWDFSGYNSVTNDDRFYFDRSHFTPEAADVVLRRIFDPTHQDLYRHRDFGRRLTTGQDRTTQAVR